MGEELISLEQKYEFNLSQVMERAVNTCRKEVCVQDAFAGWYTTNEKFLMLIMVYGYGNFFSFVLCCQNFGTFCMIEKFWL